MKELNREEYTCGTCENYKCECRCAVEPGEARDYCEDCGPVPCFAHAFIDCTCTKMVEIRMNEEKVVEAFVEMMVEIPCCGCCGSDEGYVDSIVDATIKLKLKFTQQQVGRMDFRFADRLKEAKQ